MKKNKEFSLIEGHFTSSDAMDLLRNLYSSKIQFHQMKNFSSIERFGIEDEIAGKRIPQLKETLDKIYRMINEGELADEVIEIKSIVSIAFLKLKGKK
jgi:hypothetical protein